ncbi:MAG: glycosyltransferase family 4 protein [candidate division KSB1 bacterium]|nr:glycosyltransferase family 4 protein [candidate division KSB1 bacterium]
MRKIRLVHIQLLPILSGVQKIMVDFLIRLDRNTYDIKVICCGEGELTAILRENGIPVILLPELKRQINPFFDTIAFLKLIAIFKKFKFDIVHTHSSKPGFLGRIAAKVAKVPVVIHTVHGFAFHQFSSKFSILLFQFLEKIAGLATDKLILLNDIDFQYAKSKKLVIERKMTKIYNGICLEKIDTQINIHHKKNSLNLKINHFIVGFVGRLWEQKAPDVFISAIPFILKKISNVIFLIVGDGHLRASLEAMAEKLGIRDHLYFLGWRTDVPEILKILDVFVQTSLWEGLSLSILEAMAAAKPVIATDIKGNNELVLNGVTGFLVPPNSPECVADCVIKLLEDKKLAERMGTLARKRVEEKFDIKLHVEQIKNIYDHFFTV